MKHCSDFRYDLEVGQSAEQRVAELLTSGPTTIEVKTDRKAHRTGNIVIEVRSRGKASGLSTTQAAYWAYEINANGVLHLFPVPHLKAFCKSYIQRMGLDAATVWGGDNNTSQLIKIPIIELIKYVPHD